MTGTDRLLISQSKLGHFSVARGVTRHKKLLCAATMLFVSPLSVEAQPYTASMTGVIDDLNNTPNYFYGHCCKQYEKGIVKTYSELIGRTLELSVPYSSSAEIPMDIPYSGSIAMKGAVINQFEVASGEPKLDGLTRLPSQHSSLVNFTEENSKGRYTLGSYGNMLGPFLDIQFGGIKNGPYDAWVMNSIVFTIDPTIAVLTYIDEDHSQIVYNRRSSSEAARFYAGVYLFNVVGYAESNGTNFTNETLSVTVLGNIKKLNVDRAPYPCNDDRDKMLDEYKKFSVKLSATCDDFTKTASNEYYSFDDLNVNNKYPWALIRYPLTIPVEAGYGLSKWTNLIGAVHKINSAYRAPSHNALIGGASESRHMFGDAVDIENISGTQEEHDNIAILAYAAKASWVEPTSKKFPCRLACIHADWRLLPGLYAQ